MKVGLSENFTAKITNALKESEKAKKAMKEDSYDSGIFQEIEEALYEAGLQPSRFVDDGVLTKNIGWTVTSSETGESQQLTCDGSWLDESLKEAVDGEFKVGDIVKVPYKYGSYTPGEFTEAPIIDIEDGKYVTVEVPSKQVVMMDQLKKWNSGLNEAFMIRYFWGDENGYVGRNGNEYTRTADPSKALKFSSEEEAEHNKEDIDQYFGGRAKLVVMKEAEDFIIDPFDKVGGDVKYILDGIDKLRKGLHSYESEKILDTILERVPKILKELGYSWDNTKNESIKESIDLAEEGFDTFNGFKNELRKNSGLYGLVSNEAHNMSTELLKEVALDGIYYAEGHEEDIVRDIKERYYDDIS